MATNEQNDGIQEAQHTLTNPFVVAFEEKGVNADAFKPKTPEDKRAYLERIAEQEGKRGVGSISEAMEQKLRDDLSRAQEERIQAEHQTEEEKAKQEEKAREAEEERRLDAESIQGLLRMPEGFLALCIRGLRDLYFVDRMRKPDLQKRKEIEESLWYPEFQLWRTVAQNRLRDGISTLFAKNNEGVEEEVPVTDPDLLLGYNKWVQEIEAEEERLEEEIKERSRLRGEGIAVRQEALRTLATLTTLHEAMTKDGTLYVYEAYRVHEKDSDGKSFPRTEIIGGRKVPMERMASFLLTVKDRRGQILHEPVGMTIKELPHPSQPVVLNPERGFYTQKEPFFNIYIKEILKRKWNREEAVMDREAFRQTNATALEMVANGGKAHIPQQHVATKNGDFESDVELWVEMRNGRVFLNDSVVSNTPAGKKPLDFSNFPNKGIVLEGWEKGEWPGAVTLRRIINVRVGEEMRAEAQEFLCSMREEIPDSAPSLEALMVASNKVTYLLDVGEWHDRHSNKRAPVSLLLENVSRKGVRTVRVAMYHTPAPWKNFVTVGVGTEVSASLELGEDASPDQRALVSMLRFRLGSGWSAPSSSAVQAEQATEEELVAEQVAEPVMEAEVLDPDTSEQDAQEVQEVSVEIF